MNTYNFHKKVWIGRWRRKKLIVGIIITIALILLLYPLFAVG